MSRLRELLRHLDAWSALVIGSLLATAGVIVLATPAPWERVAGTGAPVRLEEPAPSNVAVFVMGGRAGACSGVLWLHVDAENRGLTAIVVAPRTVGFSPGDGWAPLADIADSAGPAVAAAALGAAVGVSMDAWVALDRKASEVAIQALFPAGAPRAAHERYRAARSAWRAHARAEWPVQYATLREALPLAPFSELGVVAFSNYVLGFGFVRSDLSLQSATSLAKALRDVDVTRIEVRAAPVVVERCRGGKEWHVDASRLEALRRSLAVGLRSPETGRLMTRRRRVARVLVIAPFARRPARSYAAEVRRSLERSAGAAVEVRLVSGADDRLAYRAARELDRRPALAALVAPAALAAGDVGAAAHAAGAGSAAPSDGTSEGGTAVIPPDDGSVDSSAAVAKVCTMLHNRRQPAVLSAPPVSDAGAAVGALAGEPAPDDCRLPISWLSEPAGSDQNGCAALTPAAAARQSVQTLVRACWPGTLAPKLTSTRLEFAFVAARHTMVDVAGGSDAAAARLRERLRLWGFPNRRTSFAAGDPRALSPHTRVFYQAGSGLAAGALAGDLGLPAAAVLKSDDLPGKVVVALGR